MGRSVFLVENVVNRRIFPSHTLSASPSTEAGLDVRFVGTGRRQRNLNRWSPAAGDENTAAYVQIDFGRVRSFDMVACDRGHNLFGKSVSIRVSSDAFATSGTEIGPVTIPSLTYPYSRLSDAPGVVTEEGAWLWRFGTYHGSSVRFYVPAMGANLKPEIVGIYLGMSFRPVHPQVLPFDFGKPELLYSEETSPVAWVGASEVGKRDRGEIVVRMDTFAEYTVARRHFERLFFARKPMWIVHDDDTAERSVLAYAPPGVAGAEVAPGWFPQTYRIPWVEHEPVIVR